MARFKEEVLTAARSRVGQPFSNHFRPNDVCANGTRTIDQCMERGLGMPGYDCSGLVIASLCDVLGIAASDWPPNFRHALQFKAALLEGAMPEPGDIIFLQSPEDPSLKHTGIYAGGLNLVHANGSRSVQRVIESQLSNNQVPYVVDPSRMANLPPLCD